MPKYSVIVPVYNVEKYLAKCIDSLLKQTFENFEIVIVDDGSTDQSPVLCDEFAKNYPEQVRVIHQKNKGLGGARNTGIDHAKGEYLLFIDSDDYVETDLLASVDSTIEETDAQMVVFDYKCVDEEGNVLENVSAWNREKPVFSLEQEPTFLFSANGACNKVYSRKLFEQCQIRFPEKEWFEDLSTVVKLYPFAETIAYIDKSFYNYFQRNGSIMKNKNLDRNREIMSAADSSLNFYRSNGFYEKYKEELEYLAFLHVYILASVRVVKEDSHSPLLQEFKEYTLKNVPNYKQNKYVQSMSKKEKLIVKLLEKNSYTILKLMLQLKNALAK